MKLSITTSNTMWVKSTDQDDQTLQMHVDVRVTYDPTQTKELDIDEIVCSFEDEYYDFDSLAVAVWKRLQGKARVEVVVLSPRNDGCGDVAVVEAEGRPSEVTDRIYSYDQGYQVGRDVGRSEAHEDSSAAYERGYRAGVEFEKRASEAALGKARAEGAKEEWAACVALVQKEQGHPLLHRSVDRILEALMRRPHP